jgi:hypothetical protein
MNTSPHDCNDGRGEPSSPGSGNDQLEQREFDVSQAAAGVVTVTVRGGVPDRHVRVLRVAILGQLARGPRVVIVEFVSAGSGNGGGTVLTPASVAALVEAAREAGEADIGFCLVVPADLMAAVENALVAGDVFDLFEVYPTVASALSALA